MVIDIRKLHLNYYFTNIANKFILVYAIVLPTLIILYNLHRNTISTHVARNNTYKQPKNGLKPTKKQIK